MDQPDVPDSALAIYAHPNDPEVSCGGTLTAWASQGARVWVLLTSLGDKGSRDPQTDPKQLTQMRADETKKAAKVLELVDYFHLDHPDGELEDNTALREEITHFIRELQPEVVLCPDPTAVFFGDGYVNNRDHRVTGWATLDAVSTSAANPHYFPAQIKTGLQPHHVSAIYLSGTHEPNEWVDISDHLDTKIDALFCHQSQLRHSDDWFRAFLRDRAEQAGRQAGTKYAEPFRKLSF